MRKGRRNWMYQAEFGGNVNFITAGKVKAYNSEGNEIQVPICEKCGCHKCQLIGKTHFAWACPMGCENGQT